jgi:uncharacterized protein (UPF0332 family)
MTADVRLFWRHAENALRSAQKNVAIDPSTAGNRAYYAAFYAVSALFMLEGKTYRRHAALESAVHRDLVNTGRWPTSLGAAYRKLHERRSTADYDMLRFLSNEEAQEAVRLAEIIVEKVRATCPEVAAE